MTSLKSAKNLPTRLPDSPERAIDSPISTAKMMIGSMSPSAMDCTGLRGTMSTSTCPNDGCAAISASEETSGGLAPTPGLTTSAAHSARVMAIPVVSMYRPTALPPTRPSFFGSDSALTPVISDTKTSGTTSMLRKRMKISPITASAPSMTKDRTHSWSARVKFRMTPTTSPSPSPMRMWFDSFW